MNFGAFVRDRREAKNIGLRQMAKMIRVSPTYLSKVERDEFPPPAEDKVKAIAGIIDCDADDLLARANRVSSDVIEIIKTQPVELAELLRSAEGLPRDMLSSAVAYMQWWAKGPPLEKEKMAEVVRILNRIWTETASEKIIEPEKIIQRVRSKTPTHKR